jgi:pimeloyl-ACP methyl ester carboxylesterase
MKTLSFAEKGSGIPMLLIHGWGGEHRLWKRQVEYWSARYRVITPDLPGHGESAPLEGHVSYDAMAESLARFCIDAEIRRPIVMGHSMGGGVSLFLACKPGIGARAVILLDSSVPPRDGAKETWRAMAAAMRDPDGWKDAASDFVRNQLFIADDPAPLREAVAGGIRNNSPALLADLMASFAETDPIPALTGARAPLLYIGASRPRGDIEKLKKLRPDAYIGQAVGCGHFINLVVPAQMHAMVDRFLELVI